MFYLFSAFLIYTAYTLLGIGYLVYAALDDKGQLRSSAAGQTTSHASRRLYAYSRERVRG